MTHSIYSLTDVGFWSGSRVDGYVVESSSPTPADPPSELVSRFLGTPVLLIMKGPVRRAVEATPVFPQLEGRAYFQDGFPLFLATEESLKDLQGFVTVSASGKDERWRVGKLDKEAFDSTWSPAVVCCSSMSKCTCCGTFISPKSASFLDLASPGNLR